MLKICNFKLHKSMRTIEYGVTLRTNVHSKIKTSCLSRYVNSCVRKLQEWENFIYKDKKSINEVVTIYSWHFVDKKRNYRNSLFSWSCKMILYRSISFVHSTFYIFSFCVFNILFCYFLNFLFGYFIINYIVLNIYFQYSIFSSRIFSLYNK